MQIGATIGPIGTATEATGTAMGTIGIATETTIGTIGAIGTAAATLAGIGRTRRPVSGTNTIETDISVIRFSVTTITETATCQDMVVTVAMGAMVTGSAVLACQVLG